MSLITPWRGRPQVPATRPPSIVECEITETEAVADSLEILCRHRMADAIRAIDAEISAWTGQYRQAHISGAHHTDFALEIRNLLVKAQVAK
jgi:hypothetical protein